VFSIHLTDRAPIEVPTSLHPIDREEYQMRAVPYVRFFDYTQDEPMAMNRFNIKIALQEIWPPGHTRVLYMLYL